MDLKKRLLDKKQKLLSQLDRGRVVSEQIRAEKLRKHSNRLSSMRPGARRAIVEGLVLHKSPIAVMREEYGRRKYERNKKYNK